MSAPISEMDSAPLPRWAGDKKVIVDIKYIFHSLGRSMNILLLVGNSTNYFFQSLRS
jgi:hypothetical protein